MAYGIKTFTSGGSDDITGDDYLVRVVSEHALAVDTTGTTSISVPEGDLTHILVKSGGASTPPHDVTLTRTSSSTADLYYGDPPTNDWSTWGPSSVVVLVYA